MLRPVLFALLVFPFFAKATSQITTIEQLYTYGTYANSNKAYINDIQVRVADTPVDNCSHGYYVSAQDNKENPLMASILLSAFHADSKVRISVDSNDHWHGSSTGKYCRIVNVALVK